MATVVAIAIALGWLFVYGIQSRIPRFEIEGDGSSATTLFFGLPPLPLPDRWEVSLDAARVVSVFPIAEMSGPPEGYTLVSVRQPYPELAYLIYGEEGIRGTVTLTQLRADGYLILIEHPQEGDRRVNRGHYAEGLNAELFDIGENPCLANVGELWHTVQCWGVNWVHYELQGGTEFPLDTMISAMRTVVP